MNTQPNPNQSQNTTPKKSSKWDYLWKTRIESIEHARFVHRYTLVILYVIGGFQFLLGSLMLFVNADRDAISTELVFATFFSSIFILAIAIFTQKRKSVIGPVLFTGFYGFEIIYGTLKFFGIVDDPLAHVSLMKIAFFIVGIYWIYALRCYKHFQLNG